MPRRPNVVFVLADSVAAYATGYAGAIRIVKTPNIDRLEKEERVTDGCRCRRVRYGNVLCRASLLTGQRATTHGIFLNDAHLPDDATTLSKVLAAAGYDTGIIGKWHLSGGGRFSFIPRSSGRDLNIGRAMERMHSLQSLVLLLGDTPEKTAWHALTMIAQTKDAQGYIKDHAKSEKPFLLCLWWGPPHNPYESCRSDSRILQPTRRSCNCGRSMFLRQSADATCGKHPSAITGITLPLDQRSVIWEDTEGCGASTRIRF